MADTMLSEQKARLPLRVVVFFLCLLVSHGRESMSESTKTILDEETIRIL